MTIGNSCRKCLRRHLSGVVMVMLFFAWGGFGGPAGASSADRILHLTPGKDHYFLGPYLDYLEDPEKIFAIEDVTSPQMSPRFVRHEGKMLNLGIDPHAYWLRFTVSADENQNSNRKWLLYLGKPNLIEHAALYIPKVPDAGWLVKEMERILPVGSDPGSDMPIAFLHLERYIQPVTLYFRLESPNIKQLPMQILTEKAYGRASRRQSLWLGIYYGIMLAMIIYNLVWLLSLREWYRLYYLFYLCSFVIAFLGINGLLGEFFHLDDHLNLILIYVLICLVFFWAHLFAKSFLITKKHAPFFDKLLSICMGIALVLAILIPFMSLPSMMLAVFIQNIVVPPIFLLAAVTALRKGFRPARFFLIAFATLALSTIYEALVFFRLLPLFTLYATQATSAIEVILLQLALADRFRTLSQEQDRIEQSLYLAREVQQNLLPHNAPQTDWLDIAGQSIYCDETGGDYYDFIINDTGGNASIGIALGDVSGHGISSALLMATVRSSLRQRSTRPGIAAEIISDVNRQLAEDVGDSGQFMTMFYMLLDPVKQQLQWVRAGHDPAIFYDPDTDAFGELDGPGVALGVLDGFNYKEFTKRSLHSGQIIVLSTDGIWEARNQKSEMFGKERLLNIIRKNSQLSARDILDAMLEALKNFQKGFEIEDDITLVVIKIK